MLVLGRKPGEYVVSGDNIMVKVVRSDDGDLRLAIDAPKEVNIMRGELYKGIYQALQRNEKKVSV